MRCISFYLLVIMYKYLLAKYKKENIIYGRWQYLKPYLIFNININISSYVIFFYFAGILAVFHFHYKRCYFISNTNIKSITKRVLLVK